MRLALALVAALCGTAGADEVDTVLAAAAKAPHNGTNPQLEVPDAQLQRLLGPLQDAVAHGGCAHRRDATSLLTRAKPADLHAFWRAQLAHVDLVVRFYAVANLASLADAKDFEAVLRQVVVAPALANVLASRLRDWQDRRAVPALAELLATPAAAANAALSLSQLPGCPRLDPDVVAPATHEGDHWTQRTDAITPYRRWWQARGARDFAHELRWWTAWKAKLVADKDLVGDGPCKN
jgi:hypothetical protein